MMERIAEASPRPRAGITGVVYLLYFLAAVFAEFFMRGLVVWRRRGYSQQHPGAPAFVSVGFSNRPHRDRVLCRCDGSLL
jgi:hypothetical protein